MGQIPENVKLDWVQKCDNQVSKLCRLGLIAGEVIDALELDDHSEVKALIEIAQDSLLKAAALIEG